MFAGEGPGVTRLVGRMTASGRAIVESVSVTLPLGDQTTAISTGTNKRRWRSPFAWTVTAIRGALASAQASGNIVTLDVNNAGNSMLSTKLTLDNNETTSTTAATACVIDTTYDDIADDALIAIDIDQCDGSTTCGRRRRDAHRLPDQRGLMIVIVASAQGNAAGGGDVIPAAIDFTSITRYRDGRHRNHQRNHVWAFRLRLRSRRRGRRHLQAQQKNGLRIAQRCNRRSLRRLKRPSSTTTS